MIQDEAFMLIIFIKRRFYTERNKTRQANFREKKIADVLKRGKYNSVDED